MALTRPQIESGPEDPILQRANPPPFPRALTRLAMAVKVRTDLSAGLAAQDKDFPTPDDESRVD